jgi:hypothetical protein
MSALRNRLFLLANQPFGFRWVFRFVSAGFGWWRRCERASDLAIPTKLAQKRTQAAEIIGTHKLVRATETPLLYPPLNGACNLLRIRPAGRVPYPGYAALLSLL